VRRQGRADRRWEIERTGRADGAELPDPDCGLARSPDPRPSTTPCRSCRDACSLGADRDTRTGRDGILELIDAASRGDATAQAAVRQVGDWLGFGVANLINIFNPAGGDLRRHVT
jgi:hypothetical protein